MATYNISIKFQQAISLATTNNPAANNNLITYTVPANSYAIITQVGGLSSGGSGTAARAISIAVNGQSGGGASIGSAGSLSYNSLTDPNSGIRNLRLAAGQTISVQTTSNAGSQSGYIYGTLFQNSN